MRPAPKLIRHEEIKFRQKVIEGKTANGNGSIESRSHSLGSTSMPSQGCVDFCDIRQDEAPTRAQRRAEQPHVLNDQRACFAAAIAVLPFTSFNL